MTRFAIYNAESFDGRDYVWGEPDRYDLDEMLEGNKDDELFCLWLAYATPGSETFPVIGTRVVCEAAS